jgi:hypothetical protein
MCIAYSLALLPFLFVFYLHLSTLRCCNQRHDKFFLPKENGQKRLSLPACMLHSLPSISTIGCRQLPVTAPKRHPQPLPLFYPAGVSYCLPHNNLLLLIMAPKTMVSRKEKKMATTHVLLLHLGQDDTLNLQGGSTIVGNKMMTMQMQRLWPPEKHCKHHHDGNVHA